MRKLLLAMMAGSFLVNPASTQVGGGLVFCTNCATEPTQVSVKLMHDLEYAKQLLQYAIQVQQLADALKNTVHGSPASLTSVAADLGMLAAVVQGGRALAWSLANDDVVFRETYPGYPALAAVGPPPPVGSYANRYAIWAQTSLDTTQGILRGAGFHGKLLATEQGLLAILRGLTASNLLNRNDAINLTGQLASEQVAQLQKLRELQLEDMTSKAAFQGYQVQKDADMVATEQQFFGLTVINPGDSRVFPTTP
jgi:P-type conjugative transfer protein TrbJ